MKLRNLPAFERFGGLDVDTQPLLLPVDPETGRITASVADNVILDQVTGEVKRAPGSSVLGPAVSHPPVRGLFEYVALGGERIIICRTRSGYYRLDDARSTWTLMHESALVDGTGQVPSFAQLGTYLVVVDGEQAFYWDGITDYFQEWRQGRMGAPRLIRTSWRVRPQCKLVADAAGPFTKNASYEFFFVMVGEEATDESPPSQVFKYRMTADSKVKLYTGYAKIGAGNTADGVMGAGGQLWPVPTGVTGFQAYRSEANLAGVWYPVASSAGGLAVVDEDDIGDEIVITITGEELESTERMTGFIGPPMGTQVVCTHIQRIFACGSPSYPNRLWWTLPGELTFATENWLDVGTARDPVVSMVSLPLETATLLVLCRNSVWTLSGYDETTFIGGLRQIAAGPGCLAPHAVVAVGGEAFFWNGGGVYRCDGTVVEPIHRGIFTPFKTAIGAR